MFIGNIRNKNIKPDKQLKKNLKLMKKGYLRDVKVK